MKKKWIEEFDKISLVIQTRDPLGLIEGGAPEDEYELEALEIFLNKRKGILNKDNVCQEVTKIFRCSFGEDISFDQESIKAMSDEILGIER